MDHPLKGEVLPPDSLAPASCGKDCQPNLDQLYRLGIAVVGREPLPIQRRAHKLPTPPRQVNLVVTLCPSALPTSLVGRVVGMGPQISTISH